MEKVFFLALLICTNLVVDANKKPNVIVILADDLGYADVGFHDNTRPNVHTPNLDKLAKGGVYFTHAYSASPICSNSRLALSTGRYPQRWGAYYYGQGGLPSNEFTIAEMMRDEGYRTMKVGKTHMNFGPKADPMKHGFDHWLGFQNHSWDFFLLSEKDVEAYESKAPGCMNKAKASPHGPLTRDSKTKESFENTNTTEVFTKESIKFIEEKNDKPFYLQLEYNAVHTVLTRAPEAVRDKYDIPERAFNREDEVWEYPLWDPVAQPDYNEWYSQTSHLEKLDPYGRKIYLAHLEYMDRMIGNIIDILKKKGLFENTLIFFSSDNGGSHQSYANNGEINTFKYCLMDGGIRVPMLLHWPKGIEKNSKVDAIVTHRDLYASIADILNYDPPKPLDGSSLFPLMDGKVKQLHPEPIFWDSGKRRLNWVVRWGDWKLVYKKEPYDYKTYQLDENGLVTNFVDVPMATGMQLYNMATDPGETTNLAENYKDKVTEMENMYKEWRSEMSDPISGRNAK